MDDRVCTREDHDRIRRDAIREYVEQNLSTVIVNDAYLKGLFDEAAYHAITEDMGTGRGPYAYREAHHAGDLQEWHREIGPRLRDALLEWIEEARDSNRTELRGLRKAQDHDGDFGKSTLDDVVVLLMDLLDTESYLWERHFAPRFTPSPDDVTGECPDVEDDDHDGDECLYDCEYGVVWVNPNQ